jgi:hypothetical protein
MQAAIDIMRRSSQVLICGKNDASLPVLQVSAQYEKLSSVHQFFLLHGDAYKLEEF